MVAALLVSATADFISLLATFTLQSGPAAEIHALVVTTPRVRVGEQIGYHVDGERFRTDCTAIYTVGLRTSDGFVRTIDTIQGTIAAAGEVSEKIRRPIPVDVPPGLYVLIVRIRYDCPDGLQEVKSEGGPAAMIEVVLPAPLYRRGSLE